MTMESYHRQESMLDAAEGNPPEIDSNDAEKPIGIVGELGILAPGTIVSEEGLARMFGRHPVTIKRAVQRGELPPPTRLLGTPVWTVGTIVKHIEVRLETAKKDSERQQKRIRELHP
jgi:hypothetical protein